MKRKENKQINKMRGENFNHTNVFLIELTHMQISDRDP